MLDVTAMKWCIACGQELHIAAFRFDPAYQDCLRPTCRQCTRSQSKAPRDRKTYDREYLADNTERIRARKRAYYVENSERIGANQRAYMRDHPEEFRILGRTSSTIQRLTKRGLLVRPERCEECGIKGKPIDAAHFDYAYPLLFRWLCRSCHRKWDVEQPKIMQAKYV